MSKVSNDVDSADAAPVASLMQELRRSTAQAHAAVEKELALMRREFSLADYRDYLLRMRQVPATIEPQLDGAYVASHADIGQMWQRFSFAVDEYGAAHPTASPCIIAAAVTTFHSLLR